MKYTYALAKLLLITGMAFAQTSEINTDTDKIACEYGGVVFLHKLGSTRIFLKDNTIKKNCTIKEIKEYWVVYMKDKSLHDIMIDKIKHIELEDELHAIYFDSRNKPVIKTIKKAVY